MDLATLFSIATVAAKYGPEALSLFQLGEKYEPLAQEVIAAVTPVITHQMQSGALADLASDTVAQVNRILQALDHPQLAPDQKSAVSAAEQEWMDRASRSDGE
jgi:hypothetical protein